MDVFQAINWLSNLGKPGNINEMHFQRHLPHQFCASFSANNAKWSISMDVPPIAITSYAKLLIVWLMLASLYQQIVIDGKHNRIWRIYNSETANSSECWTGGYTFGPTTVSVLNMDSSSDCCVCGDNSEKSHSGFLSELCTFRDVGTKIYLMKRNFVPGMTSSGRRAMSSIPSLIFSLITASDFT